MKSKLNILVVDDSLFMGKCLFKIIKKTQHNAIGYVDNGLDAIDVYKEYSPDLVFMDITMPKLDGISALQAILKYDPNAYIVMCSSMGQDCFIKQALSAGAKGFVIKPFDEAEIRSKILECFIYNNHKRLTDN